MYDCLESPFRPDIKRGRWASSIDFLFACSSQAFGTSVFSELPVYAFLFGGVYLLPAYFFAMLLYAVPVFAVQCFLGQFSSSGIISALRVAPLFKGVGYAIVLLNLSSLSYYGVIASVPLVYAVNSLYTVIPWMSCDNAWNSVNCSVHSKYDEDDITQCPHATVEFFRSVIRSGDDTDSSFSLSWSVLCGVLGVWLLTLVLVLKRVSFIGKVIRCSSLIMFTFFVATFVNLLINSEISLLTIRTFLEPALGFHADALMASARTAIIMATGLLGSGWGSVLTMASFNSFRRDSESITYWISAMHLMMTLMAMICGRIAFDHFEDEVGMLHYHVDEKHSMQFLYLCFAYLLASFDSLPNFWCFLFFTMLVLAELSAMVVQLLSVLTTLFDEFEILRKRKSIITICLVISLMATSVYFSTKQGFYDLSILPLVSLLSHVTISMILLSVTTWIYGRDRFQCDLQFMLGKTISSFKIFLLRFITPSLLVVCILQILFLLEKEEAPSKMLVISQSVLYTVAPAYAVYKLSQTKGTLRNRLRQCLAPQDWHPVDTDNRRFYDEIMGNSEMLVLHGERNSNAS